MDEWVKWLYYLSGFILWIYCKYNKRRERILGYKLERRNNEYIINGCEFETFRLAYIRN